MTSSALRTVGILVAYNTSPDILLPTVRRLAPQLYRLLVMDNSDDPTRLAAALSNSPVNGVEHHSSGGNQGIADAQNRGISKAVELSADFALFLDDDSTFPDDGVKILLADLEEERRERPETVGIGPRIVDSRSGQALIAVWEGSRIRPGYVTTTVEVAYLVSSGALIDVSAFEQFGLFRSEYFIDHVDQEWGFRVGLLGGRLIVTANVTMPHALGDTPTTTRRGAVRYQHTSSVRDYYLTRNAILLMRDLRLPTLRYLDLMRVLGESVVRKLLGRNRTRQQKRAVIDGVVHGIVNRRGPR